jgi:hypothetical protein
VIVPGITTFSLFVHSVPYFQSHFFLFSKLLEHIISINIDISVAGLGAAMNQSIVVEPQQDAAPAPKGLALTAPTSAAPKSYGGARSQIIVVKPNHCRVAAMQCG